MKVVVDVLGSSSPTVPVVSVDVKQFVLSFVQCRFTATDTLRTIRDGEPKTSTSTFVQLWSSVKPHSRRRKITNCMVVEAVI